MLSFVHLLSAAGLACVWILWRLFREYVIRSPLDNIPGPESESFLTGNMLSLFDRVRGWDYHDRLRGYGPVVRLNGLLGTRMLYIYDPKGLQEIMRSPEVYEWPPWQIAVNKMVFGPGLLALEGEQHHLQRKIVTPVFSGEHLRDIVPLFYRVAHRLCDSISSSIGDSKQEVDILDWMSRAALELIAQGGFGHSFDTMAADLESRHPVYEAVKNIVPVMFKFNLGRLISAQIEQVGSPRFRRSLIKYIPHSGLQQIKRIADDLWDNATEIVQVKTSLLEKESGHWSDENEKSKDLLGALVKANRQTADVDRLSTEQIIAQIGTFLFAGTDTTSNALARTLSLLAIYPVVQDKLRREIIDARGDGGDFEYDTLEALPYLDAVCRETLRLYAPVNFQPRRANKDIIMHFSREFRGVNGSMISEVLIPKGTDIIMGFNHSNTNEELWGPDALEWKPERWLSPLPRAVTEARIPGVYSNLMSFGGGKHSCIGFRFSQLEMKVILSELVPNFQFQLSDKEIIWNFSGINYPSVDKEGKEQGMILNLQTLRL